MLYKIHVGGGAWAVGLIVWGMALNRGNTVILNLLKLFPRIIHLYILLSVSYSVPQIVAHFLFGQMLIKLQILSACHPHMCLDVHQTAKIKGILGYGNLGSP